MSCKLFFFGLLLFICGCVGKLATESGHPEITISNVDKQKVLDGIVAWSASKGQHVVSTNEYGLTTEGPVESGFITIHAKTYYTIVKRDSSIRIYASQSTRVDKTSSEKIGEDKNGLSITTSKTVGQEERQLRTQEAYDRVQASLEEIKAFILSQ